jgi:Zn-dependent protease
LQPNDLVNAVFEFVLLIFSLSVHECAHAWTASRLGDQTARMEGRVTLNPISHVDPFGTLLLPGLMIFGPFIGLGALGGYLIGWAKPCPVNTRFFRKIVRDDTLVTLAGPASNLLIALCAFIAYAALLFAEYRLHILNPQLTYVAGAELLCGLAIEVNIMLFLFNLLPIPPLDGSRVLRHHLPYNWLNTYDNIGIFSYILMIFVGAPIIGTVLNPAMDLVNAALSRI